MTSAAILFGGHIFAFGVDDFRAALALGFGLAADGANHLFGQIHLLSTIETFTPHAAVC